MAEIVANHDDHRKRIKDRFLEFGLDSFAEHEMLELLLYYAIPRKDVNPLAHSLIDKFGSLAGVFDAQYSELLKMPGVGENSATLIKLIPEIGRKYEESFCNGFTIVNSIDEVAKLFRPKFVNKKHEELWVMCLDGKGRVLDMCQISSGTSSLTLLNNRKLLEVAIATDCICVIIAHNHPSGTTTPSKEDKAATLNLGRMLNDVGVSLADHLIFARGEQDYISLREDGLWGRAAKKSSKKSKIESEDE